MFIHTHPYQPFFPENASKLIVGTLPPPRFTTGELKPGDVDFCYGSISGLLWPVLDRIFKLNLTYENTKEAINQRKSFLVSRGIGICDIVQRCKREKIDASDMGMITVELRDLIVYLQKYPKIKTLLFTGGNSKNGPEYFFRKLCREYGLQLEIVSKEIPRIHKFDLQGRTIRTVSLTAPSGAANRAVGSLQAYKAVKKKDKNFNTIDFRVLQYERFF